MTRTDTDPFLRGYLDAALWTTDTHPGSGDYVAGGRAAEMWPRLPSWFVTEARAACERFLEQHASDIGDKLESAGHCFWLSRNGHGSGFFDSDHWPDDVRERLQEAARGFREHDLMPEDIGQQTDP